MKEKADILGGMDEDSEEKDDHSFQPNWGGVNEVILAPSMSNTSKTTPDSTKIELPLCNTAFEFSCDALA